MTTFVLDPSINTVASVTRTSKRFQRRQYKDKQFKGDENEWKKKLEASTTVYVGNLSCYTNEYQLYELFSRCGNIKRIIMGLDRFKKTPCGFCFVEFDDRASTMNSIRYLNKTHLDGRNIDVDIDAGFEEGRQFGRGSSGGQIGDERRKEREQGLPAGNYPTGNRGNQVPILTRSITLVTLITLISVLLICHSESAQSAIVIRPFGVGNLYSRGRYISSERINQAQLTKDREQFERSFAQFLVNIMKSAKPTLMKEFIRATLADEKLKDIAIGMFFNNTNSGDDE